MTKSKWFDNCTLCGVEKQLTTVQLTGKGIYVLWLRRMCEDCRNKTLFHFYRGLGYKEATEAFRKKLGNSAQGNKRSSTGTKR